MNGTKYRISLTNRDVVVMNYLPKFSVMVNLIVISYPIPCIVDRLTCYDIGMK